MKRVLTLVAVPLLLALLSAPAEAASSLRITKIHYAQSGTDLNTEYIVFKNFSSSAKYLTGWKIWSSPGTDNQYYKFGTTRVAAGASLTLYTGRGTNTTTKRYWGNVATATSNGAVWNNDGDYAVLRNSSGTTMDTCRYAGGGTTMYC
ncbi:hypothetical protein GCM10011584_33060 [Nocardioides phosphati]|uniref:LTD domain-containing protein n=1 Tax=Nocardioides phosphati TaxID=1867775 RepID=A0ABQ2NDE3_9ACTN|nr:lamin tail domain-containing protein [Nocardioides phosphati]GGO93718.1 hypothetical protein GCM10011584_33060 [Nocardioides phosphati]